MKRVVKKAAAPMRMEARTPAAPSPSCEGVPEEMVPGALPEAPEAPDEPPVLEGRAEEGGAEGATDANALTGVQASAPLLKFAAS